MIPLVLFEAFSGLYAGQHRFAPMARMEGSIALITIGLFAAAAASEMLTVGSAITIKIGVAVPFVLAGFWSIRHRVGAARFSAPLAAESLRHGSKLQIAGLAELGNTHLDILILTAFVEPRQIGLYAIAMMSASVFPVIANRVRAVLLPVAASPTAGQNGTSTPMDLITRTIRVMTLGSAMGAANGGRCHTRRPGRVSAVARHCRRSHYVPAELCRRVRSSAAIPGQDRLRTPITRESSCPARRLPGSHSSSHQSRLMMLFSSHGKPTP